MPEHAVDVTYTEELVRFAVFRYWRVWIGEWGFVLGVIIPMIFAIMFFFGYPQWALGLFEG